MEYSYIIPVLMASSVNPNICATSVSIGINWFLIMIKFSCFFACLVIFDWKPYIMNFILLGAGYFCIRFNNSWILFWDVVKLLGNSLILLDLVFKVC